MKEDVDAAMLALEAELLDAEFTRRGDTNIAEMFLEKLAALDAVDAKVEEQIDRIKRQQLAKRKALWWNYGNEFEAQVRREIAAQGGKKKSRDYVHGRAGLRKTGGKETVIVEDEDAATNAAELLCPEAVKRSLSKAKLLKHIKDTGEVLPGTRIETTPTKDDFYPKRPDGMPELESDEQHLLEKGSDDDCGND